MTYVISAMSGVLLLLAACTPIAMPNALPSAEATVDPDAPIAPEFTLHDLQGNPHQLSDYRGQWVILNFWQTTCAPCVEEMPIFQELEDEHDELAVIAVNIREDASRIQQFLAQQNLDFTAVLLSQDQVSLEYQVMALPQTVVIDPQGIMRYRQFGAVDLDTFSQRIEIFIQQTES